MFSKTKPSVKKLSEEIEALDLNTENDELIRLEGDRQNFQKKANEAQAEASRLAKAVHEWTGPDPSLVADALLNGSSPSEAAALAPSKDELTAKKQALTGSVQELMSYSENLKGVMESRRQDMNGKISEATRPFVEEIMKSSEAAAKQLLENAATLSVINDVSKFYLSEVYAHSQAKDALCGADKILPHQRSTQVPSDVVKALKPLEEKGRAARITVRNEVTFF